MKTIAGEHTLETAGKLYIVPTPIGNLDDITLRALDVLKQVDVIAAEDTRHSRKLMQHYQIDTRLIALHEHNESQKAQQVIEKLKEGVNMALISDAGTPLISDPGYHLVNACREAGMNVIPLPGACAAITALSASGLPTDSFVFYGFLPAKGQAKADKIQALEAVTATAVFYESPRRVLDTVSQIAELLGSERGVVLARELTKTFESYFSGSAAEAKEWLEQDDNHQRGEFVLMVAGASKQEHDVPVEAVNLLKALMAELPLKKAAAITAQHFDLKKNSLYQLGLSLDQ